MLVRKSKSMERKNSAEVKLEIQRKELEAFQEQLRLKQEQDMERASFMKKSLETQQLRVKLWSIERNLTCVSFIMFSQ